MRLVQIAGIKRCIVGYSGGKTDDPTYRSIQDYTEALLVEYDPKVNINDGSLFLVCALTSREAISRAVTLDF